jgi:hypothetical protein
MDDSCQDSITLCVRWKTDKRWKAIAATTSSDSHSIRTISPAWPRIPWFGREQLERSLSTRSPSKVPVPDYDHNTVTVCLCRHYQRHYTAASNMTIRSSDLKMNEPDRSSIETPRSLLNARLLPHRLNNILGT